jgi:hypothetical protein
MSTPSTDKRGTRDGAISHDLVQMADKTSELNVQDQAWILIKRFLAVLHSHNSLSPERRETAMVNHDHEDLTPHWRHKRGYRASVMFVLQRMTLHGQIREIVGSLIETRSAS